MPARGLRLGLLCSRFNTVAGNLSRVPCLTDCGGGGNDFTFGRAESDCPPISVTAVIQEVAGIRVGVFRTEGVPHFVGYKVCGSVGELTAG